MNLASLLSQLRQQGIRLRLENDRICWRSERGDISPELRQQLDEHGDAIKPLLSRAAASGDHGAAAPSIDDGQPIPLSFAQERFWFLQQFVADPSVYHVPLVLELGGVLDKLALQRAIDLLVTRHESLRTCYGSEGQHVGPTYSVPVQEQDIRREPVANQASVIRELAMTQMRAPFDLTSGQMLRASIISVTDEKHVLVLVMHHIACDAWSLGLLLDDLTSLYESLTSGEPIAPASTHRYAGFAAQQRKNWSGGQGDGRILERLKRLKGGATGTAPMTDRPRPPVQTYAGSSCRFRLPRGPLDLLRGMAANENASMFMALLAVAKLLLFRYTRHGDITVGVPMVGRHREEWQSVVGCFLNTLVACTPVRGEMSGFELLRAVRSSCLESYADQDIPFEKLVDAMQMRRDLSYNPLFQVMFFVQDEPIGVRQAGALSWQRRTMEGETSKFDLSFEIELASDGAELVLRYNTDIFDTNTVERLGHHFTNLLRELAERPDQPIGRLAILTEQERQALTGWNSRVLPASTCHGAHELFANQAAEHPDAIALVCGNTRLSYGELNRRANRVARALTGEGIGSGDLVGIHLSRGPTMLESMLGVWKAGAAYVPIDPAYPAERISYMLGDAQPSIVLTERDLAASLVESRVRHWIMEEEGLRLGAQPDTDPATVTQKTQLSHVIYTSGSTGKPKGTLIEHGGVMALLQWAKETYATSQLSHVLASTSICFDLSVFELFVPLAFGGCVHLVENILHLPQHPERETVTLINTVPSALHQLLQNGMLPGSVGVLNLAGEPLRRDLVDRAYAQPQVRAIYNLYGPTEDTTYSTWVKVPREDGTPPSIGVPLPGKQVHILDEDGQAVPPGVPGELFIAGAGLARGYHHRPDLDSIRFVAHPDTGVRMYRTGDLARYRPDGQIEYLGRTDFQVKVRGFRIEPGEIEAVLRQHPCVDEAVVVARQDRAGATYLAGYVTHGAQQADASALRTYLKEHLPAFMVPTTLVVLDALPMTLNGKIDRTALPEPELRPETACAAPARTSLEKDIAAIWQELLGDTRAGINDNFFEVGGHSLLVLQMQARIKSSLGRSLPIVDLFRFPTIHSLAQYMQASDQNVDSFADLKNRTSKRRVALAQQRHSHHANRT